MRERSVIVSNRLGLHARAAARLVRRASEFASTVWLVREDTQQIADGKSILAVLLLAVSCGTTIVIKADGVDEENAVAAIVEMVQEGFGEELSDGVI